MYGTEVKIGDEKICRMFKKYRNFFSVIGTTGNCKSSTPADSSRQKKTSQYII